MQAGRVRMAGVAGRTAVSAIFASRLHLDLTSVLIEKLLRSCGDIDTIYVLIRNKKGKDATARLHEMLNEFLFEKAHEVNPKGIHKVVPIVGDMELPGLGMSDEDRKTVTSKATVIINAAATVKFDEKLSVATAINVKGTREVLRLANECRNLKAITHVSTAFANTHIKYIEEKFYEPPMSVEALEAVSELNEELVEGILPTQTSDIPIYNFVSGAQNPIRWGKFIELNRQFGIEVPTTKAVWYYGLNPTNNYYMFLFYNFFLHYLPALLVDTYCALTGRRRAMLKLYSKVMKMANILFYFSTQDWKFSDRNVRGMWSSLSNADKAMFPFSLREMSWVRLCETFLIGLRVYLIKDDLSTLPEARKKWNRLFYLHQILKTLLVILILNLTYVVLKPIFSAILG
ncbi:hypothetical protein evm_012204 [Chilo suppressalis]|nr:hypothetical protein evm_012204 [Chilo suppressalis]